MKLKEKFAILFFILSTLLIFSCSSGDGIYSYNKTIRYFSSSIRNIDRYTVILSDGSTWKTNRLVIAVNLMEVMFVLEEYIDIGHMYVNGSKYNIRNIADFDVFKYEIGYMHLLSKVDTVNNIFVLHNGSSWGCSRVDIERIKLWQTIPEVIINFSKNLVINPRKIEYARVIEITQKQSKAF